MLRVLVPLPCGCVDQAVHAIVCRSHDAISLCTQRVCKVGSSGTAPVACASAKTGFAIRKSPPIEASPPGPLPGWLAVRALSRERRHRRSRFSRLACERRSKFLGVNQLVPGSREAFSSRDARASAVGLTWQRGVKRALISASCAWYIGLGNHVCDVSSRILPAAMRLVCVCCTDSRYGLVGQ